MVNDPLAEYVGGWAACQVIGEGGYAPEITAAC